VGKARRKQERQERREGKGPLVQAKQRRKIAREAVANGPAAKPSPTAKALEDRPEFQAHMDAWADAGFPTPTAA
jgi:hypothetical protein